MPVRITTYDQAFELLGVQQSAKIKSILAKLEKEGRNEKSICFALWKSQESIRKFRGDPRFYAVFENEIKKWSWSRDDPRWKEYNQRKIEESKAAKLQREEDLKRTREFEYKERYPGFIYFIQGESGGPIKIGYATDVYSRLKTLQTGHPDNLKILCAMPGNYDDEKKYHQKFAEYRIRGEWFKPCEAMIEIAIKSNKNG
jgi:hypothetical protein